MDRLQCKLKLASFNSIRNLTGLQYAVIFFKGSISHEVEERHIFSFNGAEVSIWVEEREKSCEKFKQPYAVYYNGELDGSEGELF